MNDRLERFRLPEPAPTREESAWLERVDSVAPVIEKHRDEAEHERKMPRAVYEALRDAGFTRMWVSREFGGEQASLTAGMVAIEALGRLDASVSWQIGVQGAIGRLSDYLPEQGSRQLFRDCEGFAVGGVKPSGLAEPVDGGYLLQGEWAMASGSAHADWLVCTSLVCKDWQPVQTPSGPDVVMLFVPASDVRFLDTWYTVGLRGTGSNHFQVDRQFVPEELAVRKGRMVQAPPERPSRAYPIGYFDFGPFSTAPVALGLAQDTMDVFYSTAQGKAPSSGTQTLAASHVVQDRFARAEIAIYSARLLLFEAARQMELSGTAGDELSSLVRLASATVGESATAAVETAYTLAGTTSLYATSRLERAFRDVNSVTKHIALSYSHFETVGSYLLDRQRLVIRR
ncbi:acyl-CoA dehydrogenase family protein [Jatrophihabitans lederbergiae]|uniref:Acyl-CoA dehydrogenase family protein n=1 Tax=Jatrophihabitans lederbergiae TaxID=3075547 RepID=A0ABU2JHH4_9ACTN|nr:acyl-CoA dehydrogenase family protein [Jatrophihabitans sp. DSM 44399]MDT0264432.1 acyl-CoA dehydrogenase family protein [Jatrophihabitans sp. DSM 44399]